MSKSVREVGFIKAIKIVWTGRGVTPLMMAATDLEEAQIRLLDMEKNREMYENEYKMLAGRIRRLRTFIQQSASEAQE